MSCSKCEERREMIHGIEIIFVASCEQCLSSQMHMDKWVEEKFGPEMEFDNGF